MARLISNPDREGGDLVHSRSRSRLFAFVFALLNLALAVIQFAWLVVLARRLPEVHYVGV
jgi:hypothetical protein